jgi:hypothetical protein
VLTVALCDQKTRDKLGKDGLAEVRARLWARDCQTCGRPLGKETPSLCIDDAGDWAAASLHHPDCRTAIWNDSTVLSAPGNPHLSWTSVSFTFPARRGGEADPRPSVLVNPGLEMIFLEPRRGTWRTVYAAPFLSVGLVQLGRELRIDDPLPGASAWLANDLISVTVKAPPEPIYETTATRC